MAAVVTVRPYACSTSIPRSEKARAIPGSKRDQPVTRYRIICPEINPIEYGLHFAQEIGMRKHYALGIRSSARGVKQGSEVLVICGSRFERTGTSLEHTGHGGEPFF